MKRNPEESVLTLGVIASCLPFAFVIISLFETTEPYNFIVFDSALMAGSFWGSVLGIIILVCNRSKKSIKTYILSLLPVVMLLISAVSDFIYSCNKP